MPIPPTRTVRAYRPAPAELFSYSTHRFLVLVLDCGHESIVLDRPGLPAVGEPRRCFACVGMGGLGLREGTTDGQ